MISTNFDTFQAHQNEPIVRQGQRTRRRRKHYHAPAKQDTSKRPPLERKSRWHGNENTQPSKTLRLRNEIKRSAATDTIHARAQRIQRSKTHRKVTFLRQSQWHGNFFHMRTLANDCPSLRIRENTTPPSQGCRHVICH